MRLDGKPMTFRITPDQELERAAEGSTRDT